MISLVRACASSPAGTKHKTILEARSGLGPIKAYPRLGPKPSGEQGGGPVDPNTQERTFHCEICNVRVNSELQLKQVGKRNHSVFIRKWDGSVSNFYLTSFESNNGVPALYKTLTVHLCDSLSAHIKSKAPGRHGGQAKPAPQPAQEAQGSRSDGNLSSFMFAFLRPGQRTWDPWLR